MSYFDVWFWFLVRTKDVVIQLSCVFGRVLCHESMYSPSRHCSLVIRHKSILCIIASHPLVTKHNPGILTWHPGKPKILFKLYLIQVKPILEVCNSLGRNSTANCFLFVVLAHSLVNSAMLETKTEQAAADSKQRIAECRARDNVGTRTLLSTSPSRHSALSPTET